MSKTDAMRALREARQEAARTASPATRVAARAAAPPARRPAAGDAVPADAGAADDGGALCGHRNMGGRSCTREADHVASGTRSHRYA